MSDPVRLEVSGGIATITLARPEKLNALDDAMVELLGRHADVIDADRSVRAVILTGEGKAFVPAATSTPGVAYHLSTWDKVGSAPGTWSSTSSRV